jgi:hypothetical protein|tara:strand:+ start:1997 stop:2164 length:168 start_codon:yes stop_codon:yes gene_type:complete
MDKSKGLGDTIDKITTKTGVKKIIRVVTNIVGSEGCGCEERKDKLNELFPYNKNK